MNLLLQREASANGATLGDLLIDGRHECFTLEDVVRPPGEKVDGKTAIPPGRYRVRITDSARFKRPMPLLDDVPDFTGIRIHWGNTEVDTLGCILVGRTRGDARVGESVLAFDALFPKLEAACAAGDVWIDIRNAA